MTGTNTGNNTLSLALADGAGGATTLWKDGLGTWILAGSNYYSGGTTIAAGTLQIGSGGTTGSLIGKITNNAALVFDLVRAT